MCFIRGGQISLTFFHLKKKKNFLLAVRSAATQSPIMSQQAVLDFSVGPLLHTLRREATTVRTLVDVRPFPAQDTTLHLPTAVTDTDVRACRTSRRAMEQ